MARTMRISRVISRERFGIRVRRRSNQAFAGGCIAAWLADRFTIMNMRALLVAALSLSMIRVTLPGSDMVCAKHDSGKTGAAHTTGGPANTGHDHGSTHQRGHKLPCETPSEADCCHALAACGMSLALGTEYQVGDPIHSFKHTRIFESAVLLSRVTAPEPPPPK